MDYEYFLERGFSVFPCGEDKRPWCAWQDPDAVALTSNQLQTAPCYGIVIPKEFIVIDMDTYKMTDEELEYSMEKLIKEPLFGVRTARGGYHYWFKNPNPEVKLKKKHPHYPFVDFLSNGCYVIGPGSKTQEGKYIQFWGELPFLNKVPNA